MHIKQIALICVLSLFASICFAKEPIICKNTYALCSAASCQAIPGMPDKALCSCSVWQGQNIGYSECKQREIKQENNQTKLVSTFALGGDHYKYMTCPKNIAWTSCLDKPCYIDKLSPDGRKAFCTCDIIRDQAFVTFAGECNTNNCNKALWSGASIEGNQILMNKLAKDTNNRMCPTPN